MITRAKHKTLTIKGTARLIAVSDIHGHLDRFKALLRKVHYNPLEDYLVIIGDFVEKGDQVLETIHYLMYLSQFPKCTILLGNCEWALDALLHIPELAIEIPRYLKRVSANGLIRTLYHEGHYDDDHETMLGMQKQMAQKVAQEFAFIESLPVTLNVNNELIFVHAGLENRDNYKECGLSSYLEMQRFLEMGHPFKQTVVVGHLPTSNYDPAHICNDIIIDEKKRIIAIDGGTGVKMISQLNALIIHFENGQRRYEKENVMPLPTMRVRCNVAGDPGPDHKIAFPHYEVEMIHEGEQFSQCYQEDTSALLMIKNEFLYERNGQLYCLDDYCDHQMTLHKGDLVKVAGIYGDYAYVSFHQEVGWVKLDFLEGAEHGKEEKN